MECTDGHTLITLMISKRCSSGDAEYFCIPCSNRDFAIRSGGCALTICNEETDVI